MNATLETEIAKLTAEQKLRLIERLWADLEVTDPPPGILNEDDPNLEAELERRLQEAKAHPDQWMTLERFKASFGDK